MAENKEVFEEMKKKIFFSCFSGNQAIFVNSVEELTEEQRNDKTKAFFDGMTLIDNAEDVEDDISQVFSITKDREQVNLQDYYSENGAFDEDSEDQFLEAVKNLMDKEDYDSESFDEDLDEDDEEEEHEGNWDRFKNIAFFTKYGDKVKLVEDVDLLDDEDLESGITYVDGNYARDEYDYWDCSLYGFYGISKNHKRISLGECLENIDIQDLMTEEELKNWVSAKPWKKTIVNIDELFSILTVYKVFELNDDDELDWTVYGSLPSERMEDLLEMINGLSWDSSVYLNLKNVKELEKFSKNDCVPLRSVILPDTIKKFEDGCFSGLFHISCKSPDFVCENEILLNKEKTKVISAARTANLSDIPETVTELGAYSFEFSRQDVNSIPKNINKIGERTFCCARFEDNKLVIPESITEIPPYAFNDCDLAEVHLHQNISKIEKGAFWYNPNLKKVIIPEACHEIPESAFGRCCLEEVIFHNNVKKIGEEAFVHNPNLKKVILPTGCEVDPGAFDEGVEIIYSDEL